MQIHEDRRTGAGYSREDPAFDGTRRETEISEPDPFGTPEGTWDDHMAAEEEPGYGYGV
jgi:hypothetical protein